MTFGKSSHYKCAMTITSINIFFNYFFECTWIPLVERPINLSGFTIFFTKSSNVTLSCNARRTSFLSLSFWFRFITLFLNKFIIRPSKRKYDFGIRKSSPTKISLLFIVFVHKHVTVL